LNIKELYIENFKSIRRLELGGFKRINVLIGRPNVGKSNILEALSVFGIPSMLKVNLFTLKGLFRFENEIELFYNGNLNDIEIKTDKEKSIFTYDASNGLTINLNDRNLKFVLKPLRIFKFQNNNSPHQLKKYHFNSKNDSSTNKINEEVSFLIPSDGKNLLNIIEKYPMLRSDISNLFYHTQTKFMYDKTTNSIRIFKEAGKDTIFSLPYNSIADTLRRVIFYKTAIVSNSNSVLLFEEPEAHAFPPYITQITYEIITSKTNQFFIVTHSPFVLREFLENAIDELGIYLVDYKDEQTIVKQLSDDKIRDIYDYGIDLFFNYENFL
jgi:hypothetical protein